jgi:hypothetical protein
MSLCDEIESSWEVFNQMPTGLKMSKIIEIVGERAWRDFLDDNIPDEASEFAIVDKAVERFESELTEYFAIGTTRL